MTSLPTAGSRDGKIRLVSYRREACEPRLRSYEDAFLAHGDGARCPRMGQFQTSAETTAMSVFLPLATVERTSLEVRFVPEAVIPVIPSSAAYPASFGQSRFTQTLNQQLRV
jgi:hypothetical protein